MEKQNGDSKLLTYQYLKNQIFIGLDNNRSEVYNALRNSKGNYLGKYRSSMSKSDKLINERVKTYELDPK